jgi:hypothetical protein
LAWKVAEQKSNYLRAVLTADSGLPSTHDNRITLEAIPIADGSKNGTTFLHLS